MVRLVACKMVSGFRRCWEGVGCVFVCVHTHRHSCLNGRTNIHGFQVSDSFFTWNIYIIHIHPHTAKTWGKRISCPSHGKNFQHKGKIRWKVKVLLYPTLALLPLHRLSVLCVSCTSRNFYVYKEKNTYTAFSQIRS